MSDPRVAELWAEAQTLPDGWKRKTELLDEAVRLADAANDDVAYELRFDLMRTANWSGDVDKLLVAFAWCAAKYDENPANKSARTLLWYTKWATHQAPKFPSVSRARIATLLDDMQARFTKHGASLRPVFQHRYYAARELGDVDDARAHWNRWWTEPRDLHADCVACEHAAHTWWALARNDDAGAVDATEDLIKRRLACAEIPHTLYASTLPALVRLGRIDDAIAFHRTGLRMLATLEHNVSDDVSTHAVFLAVTNNLTTAVRVMNRALPRAAEHKQPSTRARVLTDLSVVCTELVKAGRTRAQLDGSALLAVQNQKLDVDARGRVDVDALGSIAWTEAQKIAALYDKRNGNRSFTDALEKKRALSELAVDAPMTKRKSAVDDEN